MVRNEWDEKKKEDTRSKSNLGKSWEDLASIDEKWTHDVYNLCACCSVHSRLIQLYIWYFCFYFLWKWCAMCLGKTIVNSNPLNIISRYINYVEFWLEPDVKQNSNFVCRLNSLYLSLSSRRFLLTLITFFSFLWPWWKMEIHSCIFPSITNFAKVICSNS